MRTSLIAQAPRREKRVTDAPSERWNRGNGFGSVQDQLKPLQSRLDVDHKSGLDILSALFRVRGNFPQSGHDPLKRDCFAATARHFDVVYRDEHFVVEVAGQSKIQRAWFPRFLSVLPGRPPITFHLLSAYPALCSHLLT